MIDTQQQLEEFRQFALVRLRQLPNQVELDDLLLEWYDSKDSDSIHASIRQGLAEMEAGKGKPAESVSRELRSKFGFPPG
jgi:Tfp pilus assembly protein PilO